MELIQSEEVGRSLRRERRCLHSVLRRSRSGGRAAGAGWAETHRPFSVAGQEAGPGAGPAEAVGPSAVTWWQVGAEQGGLCLKHSREGDRGLAVCGG